MNHKFSLPALCALVIFCTTLLPNATLAQSCTSCATMQAAADRITQVAIQSTSDANYVANHSSGNGNANQFNQRLVRLGNALLTIRTDLMQINDLSIQGGFDGLQKESSEIMGAYQDAQSAYRAIDIQLSAGLPVPTQAALDLRDAITALRDASPCIRREIQELDE